MKKIFLSISTLVVINVSFASQVEQKNIELDLDSNSCVLSILKDPSVADTVPKPECSEYLKQHYPDNDSNPISGYDENRGEGVPFRTTSDDTNKVLKKDLN